MPCRVLIVEDDADVREMMAQLLTLEGFDAVTATDGVEALVKLEAAGPQPHVIVLDMMMPRMDGWTFVDRQISMPAIAEIPVIIVSAAPADRLRAVPVAAVLQKPVNFDELLAALRTHC
jgi:CheY-like chemotaxis protein